MLFFVQRGRKMHGTIFLFYKLLLSTSSTKNTKFVFPEILTKFTAYEPSHDLGKPQKKILLLMAGPLRKKYVFLTFFPTFQHSNDRQARGGLGLNGRAIQRKTFFLRLPFCDNTNPLYYQTEDDRFIIEIQIYETDLSCITTAVIYNLYICTVKNFSFIGNHQHTGFTFKWMFDCNCSRCCDPTECGSFISALLCKKGQLQN